MKKLYYFILVIILILIAGVYFYNKQGKELIEQPIDKNIITEKKIISDQVRRQSQPTDEESCKKIGGRWLSVDPRFDSSKFCEMPTSDGGKVCSDQNECEGSCLANLSNEDRLNLEKTDGPDFIYKNGQCTSWKMNIGCNAFVYEGKVSSILCVD
ncbi:MAG: hypothetical protein WCW65_02725 [Candidatus Paceibacterota bacterium]